MQCSPTQLKDKLLKALDKDQNVVDMPSVLQVISYLENYPITREALEQTRIGKFVNEMRRKTKDKDLARRAKNLVKKWKELIEQQQQHPIVNGEGLTGSGSTSNGTHVHPGRIPDRLRSITGPGSKPQSPLSQPGTPSSGRSNISPNLSSRVSAAGSRPATPLSRQSSPRSSRPATPSGASNEQSSGHGNLNNNNAQFSVKHLEAKASQSSQQPLPPAKSSMTPGLSLSKTNVANKRKRRHPGGDAEAPLNKKSAVSDMSIKGDKVNGVLPAMHRHVVDSNSNSCDSSSPGFPNQTAVSYNKTAASSSNDRTANNYTFSKSNGKKSVSPPNLVLKKNSASVLPPRLQQESQDKVLAITPKVKTTAELIREMSASSGLRVAGSRTATKIVLNQIHKEEDDIHTPVVPASAKPRFRRKPGTSSSATIIPPVTPTQSLSQAKNEMMEKFLQSQSPNPAATEDIPMFLRSEEDLVVDSHHTGAGETAESGGLAGKVSFFVGDDDIQLADSLKAQGANKSKTSLEDLWAQLPPLNLAEIDWTSDDYTEAQPKPVSEESVELIANDKVNGVNGQYDHNEVWHAWTDTQSRPSFGGDLIHVLPYVNIDDF